VKFLIGVVFGVVLVALGGAAVVYTGSFNTAATVPRAGSRNGSRRSRWTNPSQSGRRPVPIPFPQLPRRSGRA
jgi:hypothetical protein